MRQLLTNKDLTEVCMILMKMSTSVADLRICVLLCVAECRVVSCRVYGSILTNEQLSLFSLYPIIILITFVCVYARIYYY
jgi:hypothetical protein